MGSSAARACVLVVLLLLQASSASEVEKVTIQADKGISVIIKSSTPNCQVCTKKLGLFRTCADNKVVTDTNVLVELQCPRREDIFREFTVKIERNIECTTQSCDGHVIQMDSSFSLLLAFNRTFTWTLKASQQESVQIDFSKTGLRQIHPSEVCEDGHSYTLQASQTTGSVTIGKYCRVGSISSVQIQNSGQFSVEVPAGRRLHNDQFNVSVGEEIKSFAKITLTFPEGSSSSELFSPNYPDSSPDNGVIQWDVQVPDKHKVSVLFLNVTQPQCGRNVTAVEYHSKGKPVLVQSLTDPQHQHTGNVSVTLRNCEMDRKQLTSSGLSVSLKVSVTRSLDKTVYLGAGAAVLAILVIVSLVVCVVVKKENKRVNLPTSIYSQGFSSSLRPGPSCSPDDEDYVYACIDDTKVYSHLMDDCTELKPDTQQPGADFMDHTRGLSEDCFT